MEEEKEEFRERQEQRFDRIKTLRDSEASAPLVC
jgi:hypothetical protein